MNWSTQSLARGSARNPKKVILGWAVIFVICLLLVFRLLGDSTTTQAKFTSNPDSKQVEDLIEDLRGEDTHAREIVIVRSESMTVDDPEFRGFVEDLTAEIETLVPAIIQP